jgi:hypothetical protein
VKAAASSHRAGNWSDLPAYAAAMWAITIGIYKELP